VEWNERQFAVPLGIALYEKRLQKGGTMKTIALLTLLTVGLFVASGCHWRHHNNNYSDGYYSR